MNKVKIKFLLPLLISVLFTSCDAAKEILKEANKVDRKLEKIEKEQKEKEEQNPTGGETPTSTTAPKPKPKEDKKVRDVPLSGKIDPDGLPVSNNEAMKKLEETTFPKFFNVGKDVTVRHRNLTAKQIETVTRFIKEANKEFFTTFGFKDDEPNANDDYTTGVIIDVFDTDALYREMFPKLFDFGAYKDAYLNAGMCFENNPAFKGNLMRIALKIFDNIEDGEFEIINIKHEFTHYLDMRYNWAGVGTEPNDWWMEGLAEYLGNSQEEKEHIRIVKKNKFTLKKIMGSDSQDNSDEKAADKKYSGGSLVIKFMFEEHVDDINNFLEIIRNGEYDTKYEKWRKAFVAKYNVEFSKWVVKLK
jgi:microbial collagenase